MLGFGAASVVFGMDEDDDGVEGCVRGRVFPPVRDRGLSVRSVRFAVSTPEDY